MSLNATGVVSAVRKRIVEGKEDRLIQPVILSTFSLERFPILSGREREVKNNLRDIVE